MRPQTPNARVLDLARPCLRAPQRTVGGGAVSTQKTYPAPTPECGRLCRAHGQELPLSAGVGHALQSLATLNGIPHSDEAVDVVDGAPLPLVSVQTPGRLLPEKSECGSKISGASVVAAATSRASLHSFPPLLCCPPSTAAAAALVTLHSAQNCCIAFCVAPSVGHAYRLRGHFVPYHERG